MSTCGEVAGSDVHALIKELAIRRVEHRSGTHSNEFQHLAEGTEVARLRRRFSFVSQQALSNRTRHHLCRQGVALASTRQLRLEGPVSVQAHRTEGVTGSEGQEGADGVGGGNGDVNGHGDGDGAGAGTGTGVEVNEGAQDGSEDGSRDGGGTGTGTGVETRRRTPGGNGDGNGDGSEDSSGDKNGDEDNGNGIGEGGREAKKRKKPQNSCRRHVGNGGDLGGKRKTCRKERVGPVAANPDNLDSNKEEGRGAQGIQGSSTNCTTSRESVSPLSCLIRGFHNKYH